MQYIINSNHLTTAFQKDLQARVSQIEEKELKIILALSDLLTEQHEDDFINASLKDLKENYGLTKSVWRVLLKLYDDIPNFTQILDNWENHHPIYNKNYGNFKHIVPINNLPLANTIREHEIQKLFATISEMCKHFKTEKVCDLLGLFIKDFDTKKSIYSISNLKELYDKREINNAQLLSFYYRFQNNYYIFYRLSSIYYITTREGKYYKKHLRSSDIKANLERLGLSAENPEEMFEKIFTTYSKYTNEPFVNYKRMLEISHKSIDIQDKKIIDSLLKEFNKTQQFNQNKLSILIAFLKFTDSFQGSMERYFDKRDELKDYIDRSKEMLDKISNKTDFSLKNILVWSSQWHIKGENKEALRKFKDYSIDRVIDDVYFEQIKNTDDLYDEGRLQSHCVYTYAKACEEGNSIIVSMRNKDKKIISTLRFTIKKGRLFKKTTIKFSENRKKFNKPCNEEEKLLAKKYFELVKEKIIKTGS